jgi:predicted Zn-ribbon and HTH transcriptional regulator
MPKEKGCSHSSHTSFDFAKIAAHRAMKLAKRKGRKVFLSPAKCRNCRRWRVVQAKNRMRRVERR